jgi:hypothetical protein
LSRLPLRSSSLLNQAVAVQGVARLAHLPMP